MPDAMIFNTLAALFRYPNKAYAGAARLCALALSPVDREAADLIRCFEEGIGRLSLDELQEHFIQTFDLSPVCSLEIGWHLFGENYERGAMLVKLRQEMRRYGLRESEELPDHLMHVLELLGRMEPERAEDFACACVLPALNKMLPAFEGKNNPWENVMKAVWQVLHGRYPQFALSGAEEVPALRVLS